MAGPLKGAEEDLGAPAPTTYVEDVDGRPPGRSYLLLRCQV
jgi:hypothetical protein